MTGKICVMDDTKIATPAGSTRPMGELDEKLWALIAILLAWKVDNGHL